MQWIKIFTSIFGNPKIQLLLKERDGDTIFRIWIQLLTIAGTSMQGGRIMFSTNQPLTVENLAKITQKTNKKIKNILDKLIHCEMIIFENNTYIIKNWEKYQSADKYEKMVQKIEVQMDTSNKSEKSIDKDNNKSELFDKKVSNADKSTSTDKLCPKCGANLVIRKVKKGDNVGKSFYGCSNFPKCRYTENI